MLWGRCAKIGRSGTLALGCVAPQVDLRESFLLGSTFVDILYKILIITHFVGLAAILGPWLAQLGGQAKRVTTTMVWGARAQVITGIALAALVSMGDDADPNHMKLGIKLLLALAIAAIAEIGKKRESNSNFWLLIGLFTLANVIVAVVV